MFTLYDRHKAYKHTHTRSPKKHVHRKNTFTKKLNKNTVSTPSVIIQREDTRRSRAAGRRVTNKRTASNDDVGECGRGRSAGVVVYKPAGHGEASAAGMVKRVDGRVDEWIGGCIAPIFQAE